ncbi:Rrf2 family transcriptional regulator [Rhodobacter sp. KR11]|uniref:RrF2 family transcriptional regulator n=1 Tax=Rhodobacter sp. KR11 TaxID=2974588 RepID=UPI0022226616|nr:Rrf2 family transcriptional regulator [Rhodobacter sp. KR11]MCW1917367.1 Rrf2 family transcriptional regulator [Rhodobacter sp. KR11]
MRLTSFTDYALRLLIYAAGHTADRVTIEEAAAYFAISHGHLKKVVLALSRAGFLASMKGRKGGFALARPPHEINIADVVLATEPDFGLFECFLTGNACRISRPCRLPNLATEALEAFIATLRKYTLADAVVRPEFFAQPPAAASQPRRGPRQMAV